MRYMHLVTALDDNGWMFPVTSKHESMMPDKVDTEYLPVEKFADGRRVYYAGFFIGSKKELVHKRSFMKLQTLIAVVGGMIKSITNFFLFVVTLRAINERDEQLIEVFYKTNVRNTLQNSQIELKSEETKVNTVLEKAQVVAFNENRCNFFNRMFSFCWKSAEQGKQAKVKELMRAHLYEKMDVSYIIKLFEQFSLLKEMILTDDQKELIENKKTEIELDA